MFKHTDIRARYISFWEKHNHVEVPAIPLVPQNDPTTLFTGSGMQQFVPYLLGEIHPSGTRLVNIQPCIRSQDIEEVGDNRHTTFFEMMGNWSLGDYFKEEQLTNVFDFLTNTDYGLGLNPERIYVSTFAGAGEIGADEKSVEIWKRLFKEKGMDAKAVQMGSEANAAEVGMQGGRIFAYDAKKNWWSRAGVPENMPAGEPGGPDSELFYEFTHVEHDPKFGKNCHPNCDCGRFLEIGNSVFMQYKKKEDGSFEELAKPNVDFGGGLERLLMATSNKEDVFTTDIAEPIIKKIESISGKKYEGDLKPYFRIITDHVKGASMLITIDINPSNKEQGYVVRRMLRRAIWMGRHYLGISTNFTADLMESIIEVYGSVYPNIVGHAEKTKQVLHEEESKFRSNLERGMKEVPKIATKYVTQGKTVDKTATGQLLFYIYESFGFPPDLTVAMLQEQGWEFAKDFEEQFQTAKKDHQDKSRSASAGKFKGGLADSSDQTLKYHTATHLLHQALFDVLGDDVKQEGSNITGERLRFDFHATHKPTEEELKQIEETVNAKVDAALPVQFKLMPKEEAETIGAKSFFKEKYPDTVKVYYIGPTLEEAYSKEFCGGPHVENTKDIGHLTIKKVEKIGASIFRMYVT